MLEAKSNIVPMTPDDSRVIPMSPVEHHWPQPAVTQMDAFIESMGLRPNAKALQNAMASRPPTIIAPNPKQALQDELIQGGRL